VKKIFELTGLIILMLTSVIITNKTTQVVQEKDLLMTEIKTKSKLYNQPSQPAIITNNTIIPGLYGKKVNVKKSYDKMKKIGDFNENYLIYDYIEPSNTLNKHYDKYIINGNKNTISLIFLLNDNENINKILKILKQNKTNATFFINKIWFEKNKNLLNVIKNDNHTIGILGINHNYNNKDFIKYNKELQKTINQEEIYCYYTENTDDLLACKRQKNHTIKPNIEIKENPIRQIKEQIKPGNMITLPVNNDTEQQLDLIIKYIKLKGFELSNLENHINEKKQN